MIGAWMNKLRRNRHVQSGFTLIELVVSVAILGVLLAMLAPMLSWAMTFIEAANRNEVTLNNRKLADGLLSYARASNGGRLPASATNGSIRHDLYNTSTSPATLVEALRNTGVPVSEILGDKAVNQNRRVYQVVRNLEHTEPLYFTTGPGMVLRYDFGVIYMTELKRNSAATGNSYGASPELTSTNRLTWEPVYPDYGAIAFSSLPLQKEMLRMTLARINRLTDRLQSEYHARLRYTAAAATTNLFPANTAFQLAGATPAMNMGCRDGWYDLSAVNVDILEQIGLNKDEYSRTAWGGQIAYCRDYVSNTASAPDEPPHYAAIRIHRETWATGTPGAGNEAIISF